MLIINQYVDGAWVDTPLRKLVHGEVQSRNRGRPRLSFLLLLCFFFSVSLLAIICLYVCMWAILLVSSSRTRFEMTIWGLVKYCRIHDGHSEGRLQNIINEARFKKKKDKNYWLAATGIYQINIIIRWWSFDDSERLRRDLDQSVHNVSRAGDICTNACILIIGTTKTYHHM